MGIYRCTRVGEECTAGVNRRGKGKDGLLDSKVDYIIRLYAENWVGIAMQVFAKCGIM